MTNRIKLIVFAMLAAAAVALLLTSTTPSSAAADGKALYAQHCASCHGTDGAGATPAGKSMKLRALGSPEVQKMTDAQLSDLTSKGKGKMPGYSSKLKPEEVKSVVAHMRTFAKK